MLFLQMSYPREETLMYVFEDDEAVIQWNCNQVDC